MGFELAGRRSRHDSEQTRESREVRERRQAPPPAAGEEDGAEPRGSEHGGAPALHLDQGWEGGAPAGGGPAGVREAGAGPQDPHGAGGAHPGLLRLCARDRGSQRRGPGEGPGQVAHDAELQRAHGGVHGEAADAVLRRSGIRVETFNACNTYLLSTLGHNPDPCRFPGMPEKVRGRRGLETPPSPAG